MKRTKKEIQINQEPSKPFVMADGTLFVWTRQDHDDVWNVVHGIPLKPRKKNEEEDTIKD